MLKKLTTWQRFWGMFAVVFLASTFSLIATLWPRPDPAVITDLRMPECQQWREIPEGTVPEYYPEANEPCYAIGAFVYHEHASVSSESEYDSYLFRKGAKKALIALAGWAGFIGAFYVLGWSSGHFVGTLRKLRNQKAA